MKSLTVAVLCTLSQLAIAGTIYKYVDASGTVTYTNIPIRGAKTIHLPPQNGQAPLSRKKQPSTRWEAPSAGNATFIDSTTQRQRDEGRRKILQQELINEEKALREAKQILEASQRDTPSSTRLQQLKEAVIDREKNISAIQTELSRITSVSAK